MGLASGSSEIKLPLSSFLSIPINFLLPKKWRRYSGALPSANNCTKSRKSLATGSSSGRYPIISRRKSPRIPSGPGPVPLRKEKMAIYMVSSGISGGSTYEALTISTSSRAANLANNRALTIGISEARPGDTRRRVTSLTRPNYLPARPAGLFVMSYLVSTRPPSVARASDIPKQPSPPSRNRIDLRRTNDKKEIR